MARRETVELALRARLDDLRTELAKVPGITQKEAKAMAKALEKELKAAEKAASHAAEATKSKWNSAIKGIQFAAIAAGATTAAKSVFSAVDSVAEYRQEIANASRTTGLATETIAGMRLAAEGAGVSFEEVRASVKDPAELEAFVELARRYGTDVGPDAIARADEWKGSLSDLQMVLQGTAADLADFLDVSGLLKSFTLGFVYAKEFVVAALDDIATRGVDSMVMLKLALTGNLDEAAILAQRYREMGTVTDEASKRAEKAAREFHDLTEATLELNVPLGETAETMGHTAEKAEDLTHAIREQQSATERLRDIAKQAAADQLTDEEKIAVALEEKIQQVLELGTVSQDYAQVLETVAALEQRAIRDTAKLREDAHEEAIVQLEEFGEAHTETFEGINEELRDALGSWADMASAISEVAEMLGEVFELTREGVEDRIALYEKELAAIESAQDDQVDGAARSAKATLGIAGREASGHLNLRETLRDARAEALRSELEEAKTQAKRLWQAERAAAISSVVFNTAAAILQGFAMFGPPPSPGGIAAAASATLAGGLAIGKIVSEEPPKFHKGLSPTEMPAILDRHEGVANRRAMSTPGFRQTLDAANRGLAPSSSGEASTVIMLNDRVLDVIVSRGLRGRSAQLEVKRVAGAGSRRRRGGYG